MPELISFGETMAALIPAEEISDPNHPCFRMHIAGAESNTAIGFRRLGHTAGWVSRLGTDPHGRYVLHAIASENVDVSHVVSDEEHRTGILFKYPKNAEESTVCYYRDHAAASYLSPADLDGEYTKSAKILHVTGITLFLSDSCRAYAQAAIDFAYQHGILVSFDPNIRLKLVKGIDYTPILRHFIAQSNVVSLGLTEGELIYGSRDIGFLFEEISRSPSIQYIAIKNGGKGAWVKQNPGTIHFIEPHPCKPVDPVGAGDAFNAGFLHGIAIGAPIRDCGLFGGIAGALATESKGDVDGYPTLDRLNEIYGIYYP